MEINISKLPIYVINLANESARRQHIIDEFKRLELNDPIFIDGIKDVVRHIGCAKSHIKALETAQKNNHEQFVLLEDDISFTNHHNIKEKTFILPKEADCLYIGISCAHMRRNLNEWVYSEFTNYYQNFPSEEFVKIYGMLAFHGVCYLNNKYTEASKKICNNGIEKNRPHDIYVEELHQNYNVYALRKPIVYQDARYGGYEPQTNIFFK